MKGNPRTKGRDKRERRLSSSASPSGGGFSPSYYATKCSGRYFANIIPTTPQFRRGEKGRVKCLEAAEVYKGTSRERSFANASEGGQSSTAGGPDRHIHPGPTALYYKPFSTMDRLNWQRHSPPYSEKPQGMMHLMETIFRTHQLMWHDITLFNTEERHQILTEAHK